jgi:hypothetical protein
MSDRAAGRVHFLPAVVLLGVLAAPLLGCNRKPHLVPAGPDSTAAIPSDSTALYVQIARDAWRSGDDSGKAADLTARLILNRMRTDKDQTLGTAAREFVDSLGMGAEGSGRDPAAVNLFSPSDPTGGSWPFLFWRDAGTVHYQPLDASGLHLNGLAVEPTEPGKAQRIATLFMGSGARATALRLRLTRPPSAQSWRPARPGTDSLGRAATRRSWKEVRRHVLEARTYTVQQLRRAPPVPTYQVRRLRWDTPGLVRRA